MIALLLALPALFAQAKPDARLAGLVADLGDAANARNRSNAYMTLQRERPPAAIPLLVDALPRFDVLGQQYGMWVLQSYPLDDSRPAWRKLIVERSPLLEAGAAARLFQQGEQDVLEHLVRPFGRTDTSVEMRRALLQAVYNMREPRLAAAVREWLAPETDASVLEDALYHLLNAEDEAARPRVRELAAAEGLDAARRSACAAFLLVLGEDVSGAELGKGVSGDDGRTLMRLQRFFMRAPRLPDEVVSAIAAVAERSKVPAYAQAAVTLLGQHASSKHIAVLEGLVDSPSALVGKAALEALQKRGVAPPRDVLARMLGATDAQRALSAADALRRMDDLSGFPRVLELVRAGGADKAEAVRVLAKFRKREAIPPLLDALADAEPGVRSAAESGLTLLLSNLFPYRRFEFASCGYAAQGAPDARAAGIAKLRAWCAANLKS